MRRRRRKGVRAYESERQTGNRQIPRGRKRRERKKTRRWRGENKAREGRKKKRRMWGNKQLRKRLRMVTDCIPSLPCHVFPQFERQVSGRRRELRIHNPELVYALRRRLL